MLGTTVNAITVIIGSLIGLFLKKGLPKKLSDAVMTGVGLCVVYLGIDGCLEGQNPLIAVISIAVGAIIGTLLDLDGKLNSLGNLVEKKFSKNAEGNVSLAQGFVSSSLLFCVGAMAIVGALQSGLTGDNQTLYTKSLLDFISAIVFASSMGIGVMFSAVAVFVYQGAIALLAGFLSPLLGDAAVAEMTCSGSILLIGLGLNLLGITKIKVMNYVPAIFLPILLCMFM
ncbi:MAG: DUF554 domain-containing protein [Clostridia bacterium]|nr:DUF554 domain-containing protein [Clostridia bacterium]